MCENKPSWWAQCGDIDIFAHLDSAEDSSVIRCKARRITRVSSEWTWALATESTANYWEVYESRLYRIIYIYFHIVMWLGYTFLYYWQVCFFSFMIYKIKVWCKLCVWRLCVLVHGTSSYRLKHRGFLLQDQCLLPTSGHNRLSLEAIPNVFGRSILQNQGLKG